MKKSAKRGKLDKYFELKEFDSKYEKKSISLFSYMSKFNL